MRAGSEHHGGVTVPSARPGRRADAAALARAGPRPPSRRAAAPARPDRHPRGRRSAHRSLPAPSPGPADLRAPRRYRARAGHRPQTDLGRDPNVPRARAGTPRNEGSPARAAVLRDSGVPVTPACRLLRGGLGSRERRDEVDEPVAAGRRQRSAAGLGVEGRMPVFRADVRGTPGMERCYPAGVSHPGR
ncbi:hypothetical protein FM112_05750 [Gulosibacter sp. 10]|nr:hypothetical protein FM112_05750 [Gulosibacter sp. 10]